MYHLKQPYNYEPTIFIPLFSNEPTNGEQIKIPALWLVHQLRGHYLHCLIGRSPNEHLFKACSHLRSICNWQRNSKSGLLSVASDHKIFTYSRFFKRPWALLSLKHDFFLFKKKQKGVIYGKEDDNYITSHKSTTSSTSWFSQLSSWENQLVLEVVDLWDVI